MSLQLASPPPQPRQQHDVIASEIADRPTSVRIATILRTSHVCLHVIIVMSLLGCTSLTWRGAHLQPIADIPAPAAIIAALSWSITTLATMTCVATALRIGSEAHLGIAGFTMTLTGLGAMIMGIYLYFDHEIVATAFLGATITHDVILLFTLGWPTTLQWVRQVLFARYSQA